MEKITREEALRRWNSAKAQKKELVEKMRKMLYEDYKARTGEEPLTFNVLWWTNYLLQSGEYYYNVELKTRN